MKRQMKFLITWLLLACPSIIYADGRYSIGRDRGGVYMQTEQDGSWYIDSDHVNHFRVGEKGTYSMGVDDLGAYIQIGRDRKFYVDKHAQEQLQTKLEDFNKKQTQDGKMETKVVVEGNQVLVPVVLGYGGNETEVLLLLDTGASVIVLHREVAEQLNMKGVKKGQLMSAGGDAINAEIVRLDSVRAGPITRKNITAGIIEFKGPSTRHQGLLGMNFLKDVPYRIDLKRQKMVWEN